MFGNKKSNEPKSDSAEDLVISTIPKEFYGGANPVIKFKSSDKITLPSTEEIKTAPAPIAAAAPAMLGSRKLLFIAAGGLFVVFILVAGAYYYLQMRKPVYTPPPKKKTEDVPVVTPTTTDVVAVVPTTTAPTSTEVIATPTTTSMDGGLLDFPSILLGNSNDADHDTLTDAEEEIFKTDPDKADTDSDTYTDNIEVYNLYSPINNAPSRIIEDGTVQEFTNPIFKYKLYYPVNWAVGNVDPEYRDVLFSTLTGENIEVRVFDRDPGQKFEDWFAKWAPNERLNSLVNFSTYFKRSGLARNDKLVYYFTDPSHVYVMVYHVTNSSVVNFRSVITMTARSFRLPGDSKTNPADIETANPFSESKSASSS